MNTKRFSSGILSAALCAAMMAAAPLAACRAAQAPSGFAANAVSVQELSDCPESSGAPEFPPETLDKSELPEQPLVPLDEMPGGDVEIA